MSIHDIHHLAAAYALDAVDDHERQLFEAHYHTCEICHADVSDHRETLARIVAAAPVAPPVGVKERVMAEIAQTRQLSPLLPQGVSELAERRRHRRRLTTTFLAAAAAVVVLVTGGILVNRSSTPRFAEELATVLDQPDSRFVTLDAAGDRSGVVRVAWSESRGTAIVLADELAPTDRDEAYELWLIDDGGTRQAMRLLQGADDDGELRGVVDIDDRPAAWGVTIEPIEGSAVPTGDVLFVSEV